MRTLRMLALFGVLPVFACTCGTKLVQRLDCQTDADCQCKLGDSYACVKNTCQLTSQKCKADTDCCPGQLCNTDLGRCRDKFTECTTDADCKADDSWNGQVCQQDALHKTTTCTYAACDATGQCPSGLICFARGTPGYDKGICVGKAPCQGGCQAGDLCVVADDRCYTPPASACGGCQPGYEPLLDDPSNVFSTCHINGETGSYKGQACSAKGVGCTCVELPPLVTHDLGRYNSVVRVDSTIYASMYDGTFGDLVYMTLDLTGKPIGKPEYVDGVPASGQVVGGPSGPRGGIAEPGDDVGRYTSLTLTASTKQPRIAYYDVTNHALKFAMKGTTGWTIHTVDNAGDVGMYAMQTADPATDDPVVLYFQRAGADPDFDKTALKIARASRPDPSSASDWVISTIDTGTHAPIPCNGGCQTGQTCISDGAGGTMCAANSSPCNPACSATDTCVSVNGSPVCKTPIDTKQLADIPQGVGLWPTAGWRGSPAHLVVAYYDSLTDWLEAAEDNGSGGWTVAALDNNGAGRTPSLALDGGNIAVAYGSTNGQTRFYYGPDLTADPTRISLIDDTARDPSQGLMDAVSTTGADVSLVALGAGGFVVSYQDQTAGDLIVKQRDASGTWTALTQVGTGESVGYYDHVLVDPPKGYAVHVHGKAVATPTDHWAGWDLRLDPFTVQ